MADGLVVSRLTVRYGAMTAVSELDLTVRKGEVVAFVGANGAGKSTLLRTLAGYLNSKGQDLSLNGRSIAGLRASQIARMGITLVPEGRRLFADLSVAENLLIGAQTGRQGNWSFASVLDVFPAIEGRLKYLPAALSGGQQQMVAIGRALMSNPEILMLDEVSLGLAPRAIEELYLALPRILDSGMGVIIVEQDLGRSLRVSDRYLAMREGRIVLQGKSSEADRDAITKAYFGAIG